MHLLFGYPYSDIVHCFEIYQCKYGSTGSAKLTGLSVTYCRHFSSYTVKMLMSSIEDNQEVLHTILVNELRNVYNIKYQKDAAKQKKVNTTL